MQDASLERLLARQGIGDTVAIDETLGRAHTVADLVDALANDTIEDRSPVVVPTLASLPQLAVTSGAGDAVVTSPAADLAVLLVNRVSLLWAGGDAAEALRSDLMLESAALATMTVCIASRMWLATALMAAGGLAAGAWPQLTIEIFSVTHVFAPIAAIGAITGRGRDEARRA